MKRMVLKVIFIFSLFANSTGFCQDLPSPTPNLVSLPAGSWVIAMDQTNQPNSKNLFNLRAYGLVVHLLNNNVRVKWIIRSGKTKDGIDFSVSAQQAKPTTSTTTQTYQFGSGPFVISAGDASNVATLVDQFNSRTNTAADRVRVYRTTSDVVVDQRYDLTGFKPFAALLNNGGNWTIHRDVLLKAGINFGISSDQLKSTNWERGVAADLLVKCYTFASEAHWKEDDLSKAKAVTDQVRPFLLSGGNVLAQCAAVRSYENSGRFHSTGGILATTENRFSGSLNTLLFPNPDLSYSQFQGALNIDKGGSLKNWTYAGSLVNNQHTHVQGPASLPNIGAAVSKVGATTGGGLMFYLGNHDYDKDDNTPDLNGMRAYLNAYLTPSVSNNLVCVTPQPGVLNLGNQVWNDYDGDGRRDSNEPGIAGIPVSLYADNDADDLPDGAAIRTVTTNIMGQYQFNLLQPGRYLVSIPIAPGYQRSPNTGTQATSPFPDNNIDNDNNGVRLVGPNGEGGIIFSNAITLASTTEPLSFDVNGNTNNTLDMAICGNMFIGDFVWNDLNANGIQDANEPGINGVTVTLTFQDGTVATTTTHTFNSAINGNAPQFDGYYDFKNLGSGTFTVSFATPPGLSPSPANQGSDDLKDSDPINGSVSFTLLPNVSNFSLDAGFTIPRPGIGDFVWNDRNNNGIQDGGTELGISGATVNLYADNNSDNSPDGPAIATTTTNSNGVYDFNNLTIGKYIIGVVYPTGFVASNTTTGSGDPNNSIENDNNGVNQIAGESRSNTIELNSNNTRIDFGFRSIANCPVSGINISTLTKYLFVFTNGSSDANWQSSSKGYAGDVLVDGITAKERTSGSIAYAGTISTNDATLGPWQKIVNDNSGQASAAINQTAIINTAKAELETAFTQINALPVTSGFNGINASSLNGLNTQNGIAQTFVINITSGFNISSKLNITGDASDIFILRWDSDANFSNGYNGEVKFQSGGAIVPLGGLLPSNFIHVAGQIGSGGGGSNPASPYPQGPRINNGTGALISGGSNFSGGGFFTGYWLTTGAPTITGSGQPFGETSSLSNAIFVGGWYSKTTKFSMTSGTSGVYVAPPACPTNRLASRTTNPFTAVQTTEQQELNNESTIIYPNPAKDKMSIRLNVNTVTKTEAIVRIIDAASGKVVLTRKTAVHSGTNNIVMEQLQLLKSGYYNVQVIANKHTYNNKVFISKGN